MLESVSPVLEGRWRALRVGLSASIRWGVRDCLGGQVHRHGLPFLLKDAPGLMGADDELFAIDGAGPTFGGKVGYFVLDEGSDQTEVAAGSGEEAVLAVGVPAGDAVFEDVIAAWRGAALNGGGVGVGKGSVTPLTVSFGIEEETSGQNQR